jgi:hypothetical protein
MIRKSSQIEESRLGRNEVFLEGRVSNLAVEKQLPSGDTVVEFRIVIDRTSRRGSKREVDTLDVAAWLAGPRKKALSLKIDDWLLLKARLGEDSGRLRLDLQVVGRSKQANCDGYRYG